MADLSPFDTVAALVDAINRGDIDAAVGCYAPHAAFVAAADQIVTGTAAIRVAMANMLSSSPTITTLSHAEVRTGDLSLCHSHWRMNGTAADGSAFEASGQSADVLRRADDGVWRIEIDNPWGTSMLAAHP